MSARVLIACFEIPTQGGAATSAYALFAMMKRNGIDVHFLNIVERAVVPYYEWVYGTGFGNPEGLPDVHTCIVEHPLYEDQPALAEVIERITPGVMLARGFIATVLLKRSKLELPLVLYTAGSRQAQFLIEHGRVKNAVDLPNLAPSTCRLPTAVPGKEGAAFDVADLIVSGSDLVRDTIHAFYSLDRRYKVHGEPVWSAEWVIEAVRAAGVGPKPFEERSIDVLFCATDWSRSEKNFPAVRRIVAQLAQSGERGGFHAVIVGECNRPVAEAEHVGRIVDRSEMFKIMADAKVVASPSLVDACPTTLFEAAHLGCNIVATKNCGNWRLCHSDLLVDPPSETGIAVAIRRAVMTEYESDLDWFMRKRSYERLTAILDALAA